MKINYFNQINPNIKNIMILISFVIVIIFTKSKSSKVPRRSGNRNLQDNVSEITDNKNFYINSTLGINNEFLNSNNTTIGINNSFNNPGNITLGINQAQEDYLLTKSNNNQLDEGTVEKNKSEFQEKVKNVVLDYEIIDIQQTNDELETLSSNTSNSTSKPIGDSNNTDSLVNSTGELSAFEQSSNFKNQLYFWVPMFSEKSGNIEIFNFTHNNNAPEHVYSTVISLLITNFEDIKDFSFSTSGIFCLIENENDLYNKCYGLSRELNSHFTNKTSIYKIYNNSYLNLSQLDMLFIEENKEVHKVLRKLTKNLVNTYNNKHYKINKINFPCCYYYYLLFYSYHIGSFSCQCQLD